MKLVLVDNYDSFTANLHHALVQLGHEVIEIRNDACPSQAILDMAPDVIVLGPGPGHPAHQADVGVGPELLDSGVPVLGICLGMQLIGQTAGAKILRGASLVHGEATKLAQCQDWMQEFDGASVGRYHSLVVADLPSGLQPLASSDGVVMALQHVEKPWIGFQFHPESYLTPQGEELLARSLEVLVAHG